MHRIESLGSVWEIDEDDLRYRRFPKNEAPRENPEWGGPEAGALQDFVWHPFISWRITSNRFFESRLVIVTAVDEDGSEEEGSLNGSTQQGTEDTRRKSQIAATSSSVER